MNEQDSQVRETALAGAARMATRCTGLALLLALTAWLWQGPYLAGPMARWYPPAPDSTLTVSGLAGTVVVIDPGHGGRDPGAVVGGVLEKDIVLPLALLVRDMLAEAGAVVVMTRETDVDLSEDIPGRKKITDLVARTELVAEVNPDVYISVHANSFSASRWRGPQVFYNDKDSRNPILAQAIQEELTAVFGVHRVAARDERQYILKTVEVPAVCVEVGFLTNPEDLRMLQDPLEQHRIAWAICRGLAEYLRHAIIPALSGS